MTISISHSGSSQDAVEIRKKFAEHRFQFFPLDIEMAAA
jgi:hypothetical protein